MMPIHNPNFYENEPEYCWDAIDDLIEKGGISKSELFSIPFDVRHIFYTASNTVISFLKDEEAILENLVTFLLDSNHNIMILAPETKTAEQLRKQFRAAYLNTATINAIMDSHENVSLLKQIRMDISSDPCNSKLTSLFSTIEHFLQHPNEIYPPLWSQAFLIAAEKGYLDLISFLIKKNLNINVRDCDGNSALIYASHGRHYSIVDLLLENGADFDKKNLLEWAVKEDDETLIKLLLKHGIDRNFRLYDVNPLNNAAENNRTGIVTLLVENGLDMDAKPQALAIYIDSLQHEALSDEKDIFLKSIQFYPVLQKLLEKRELFRLKAHCGSPQYLEASTAIQELTNELIKARRVFCENSIADTNSQQLFITTCLNAINNATPVLSHHRDVMGLIAKCALLLFVLPVFIYQAFTGALFKTDTQFQVDALKKRITFFDKKLPAENSRNNSLRMELNPSET